MLQPRGRKISENLGWPNGSQICQMVLDAALHVSRWDRLSSLSLIDQTLKLVLYNTSNPLHHDPCHMLVHCIKANTFTNGILHGIFVRLVKGLGLCWIDLTQTGRDRFDANFSSANLGLQGVLGRLRHDKNHGNSQRAGHELLVDRPHPESGNVAPASDPTEPPSYQFESSLFERPFPNRHCQLQNPPR